jgi:hypothetical protein
MADTIQFKPTRVVTLVLIGAIADFTEPVEEHRSTKRILLFALGPRQDGFDGGKGIGAACALRSAPCQS